MGAEKNTQNWTYIVDNTYLSEAEARKIMEEKYGAEHAFTYESLMRGLVSDLIKSGRTERRISKCGKKVKQVGSLSGVRKMKGITLDVKTIELGEKHAKNNFSGLVEALIWKEYGNS